MSRHNARILETTEESLDFRRCDLLSRCLIIKILPQATDNAVAGHMWPTGLGLSHLTQPTNQQLCIKIIKPACYQNCFKKLNVLSVSDTFNNVQAFSEIGQRYYFFQTAIRRNNKNIYAVL